MNGILKEFLKNGEAMNVFIDNETTYLSIADVETLMERQKNELLKKLWDERAQKGYC